MTFLLIIKINLINFVKKIREFDIKFIQKTNKFLICLIKQSSVLLRKLNNYNKIAFMIWFIFYNNALFFLRILSACLTKLFSILCAFCNESVFILLIKSSFTKYIIIVKILLLFGFIFRFVANMLQSKTLE